MLVQAKIQEQLSYKKKNSEFARLDRSIERNSTDQESISVEFYSGPKSVKTFRVCVQHYLVYKENLKYISIVLRSHVSYSCDIYEVL